jgi:hypothetical protein
MDQAHLIPICVGAGALFVLVLVALEVRERNQAGRERRAREAGELAREQDRDGFGGGFPVPPMPGARRAPITPRPLRSSLVASVAANGHTPAEEAADGRQ